METLFSSYKTYCEDSFLECPTNKDKKYFKNIIEEKFNLTYRKLNRSDGNKYGFEGISLKDA
jgi:putative DNA primase/helicase